MKLLDMEHWSTLPALSGRQVLPPIHESRINQLTNHPADSVSKMVQLAELSGNYNL